MNPFTDGSIDGVFVIHGRQFTERGVFMAAQLQRLGIPFEFVEGFEKDEITPELIAQYYVPNDRVSLGKKSCALKHIEALRRIAARNCSLALVLEDDAVLPDDFVEELGRRVAEAKRLPHRFVVHLGSGGNMFTPAKRMVPGQYLYQADAARCAEAYLITADTARARLEWLSHNKIDRPNDHLSAHIDQQVGNTIYWGEPPIVTQGSKNGRFHSELDPLEPLWWTRWRFLFQRLRRKYLYRFF